MPLSAIQGLSLVLDDDAQGVPPFVGQMRYDAGAWTQRDAVGVYNPRTAYQLTHDAMGFLSHYVNDWPAAGRYKVVTGTPFPSQVAWYQDSALKLLAATTAFVRNVNGQATQITYQVYAADGVTVLATATDTVAYSGPNETTRSRVLS